MNDDITPIDESGQSAGFSVDSLAGQTMENETLASAGAPASAPIKVIAPTVGRVVWFTPSTTPDPGFVHHDSTRPCAAMVTHVWNDRMVNLVVFDSNGAAFGKTSVQLLQGDDPRPEYGCFCAWMPYQIGQAAKHAAA